jgi:hypothetical protein
MKQIGIFDEAYALERLSKLGDKLEWLNDVMDWGIFQKKLEEAKPDRTKGGKGGRPPYPVIMMFKVLILQNLFNVADDSAEYQINDRLSWKRFLGLSMSDKAPDAKTIWDFRETLVQSGVEPFIAKERAHHILYENLNFCPCQVIDDIIEKNYQVTAHPAILVSCYLAVKNIFDEHPSTDEFLSSPEYDTLSERIEMPVIQYLRKYDLENKLETGISL